MRHTAFVEFVAQLKQLTPEQRKQLVRQLMGRESAPVPHATAPLPAPTGCPHCSAAVERLGVMGPKSRTQALSLPGLRPNLQRPDRHSPGAFAQARTMDALRRSLD